ncbi:hypothetical protein RchiOBHm_Chr7g0234361 [Rosa chinensis]|uniref:Uncharacterized protein n=1 Tax=Rosa chinensis TaxID=74649 RepID=A0A2P6PGE1_ROSCH|nr:hypothetical protein RchiOBHm_Chr7g0234361 [Rosa chinensis]
MTSIWTTTCIMVRDRITMSPIESTAEEVVIFLAPRAIGIPIASVSVKLIT